MQSQMSLSWRSPFRGRCCFNCLRPRNVLGISSLPRFYRGAVNDPGDREEERARVRIYLHTQALYGGACRRLLEGLTHQNLLKMRRIFLGTAEFSAMVTQEQRESSFHYIR